MHIEPSGFVHVHVVAASRSVASASRGSFDFTVGLLPRERALSVTAPVQKKIEREREKEKITKTQAC